MISKCLLLFLIFFSIVLLLLDLTKRMGLGNGFRRPPSIIDGDRELKYSKGKNSTLKHSSLPPTERRMHVNHAKQTQGQLESGVKQAISRLNYEFSNASDAIHANDAKKESTIPRQI